MTCSQRWEEICYDRTDSGDGCFHVVIMFNGFTPASEVELSENEQASCEDLSPVTVLLVYGMFSESVVAAFIQT